MNVDKKLKYQFEMKINYSPTELVKHIKNHRDVVGITMPVSYRQMHEGMSEMLKKFSFERKVHIFI
jgi:hypothetical protein